MAAEFALFLSREMDKADQAYRPRLLAFAEEVRTQLRLNESGLRTLSGRLRQDLREFAYELERALGGAPIPPPPEPPAAELVSLQGARTRPDLPESDDAPPVPEPEPEGGVFAAGRRAAAANYRCTECDAVITLAGAGTLPPCECSGRGWVRLE